MMKRLTVFLTATLLMTAAVPFVSEASTLGRNYVSGCSDELMREVSKYTEKIPEEIIDYYLSQGGKIEFVDSLSVNGINAMGSYEPSTEKIHVSREMSSYGMDYMTAHYLAHELGHFIYEHTSISDSDRQMLNDLYSVYVMYGPPFVSVGDTFAELYASQITGVGGYWLNPKEEDLIKRIEGSVIEKARASEEYFHSGTIIKTE